MTGVATTCVAALLRIHFGRVGAGRGESESSLCQGKRPDVSEC